jgi:hypothetical protein
VLAGVPVCVYIRDVYVLAGVPVCVYIRDGYVLAGVPVCVQIGGAACRHQRVWSIRHRQGHHINGNHLITYHISVYLV